jgi:hypothetical protein
VIDWRGKKARPPGLASTICAVHAGFFPVPMQRRFPGLVTTGRWRSRSRSLFPRAAAELALPLFKSTQAQGDRMSLWKKSPRMWPNHSLVMMSWRYNLSCGKTWPKNVGYLCNFQKKKLSIENNRQPRGENSPNLATLLRQFRRYAV